MVVGSCWLFQTLALLDIPALYYIGMVFAIIQGELSANYFPLVSFVILMPKTH